MLYLFALIIRYIYIYIYKSAVLLFGKLGSFSLMDIRSSNSTIYVVIIMSLLLYYFKFENVIPACWYFMIVLMNYVS